MDDYQLVLAEEQELPEIMGIYRSLAGTPGCDWNEVYPDRTDAEADLRRGALYLLKKGGRIVALASANEAEELKTLKWAPQRPCELARLGVVQSAQNRGIGTILVQKLAGVLREKGYDGIVLLVSKTNRAALALYEKNGFEKCGEAFLYGIDFDCYQLCFAPGR